MTAYRHIQTLLERLEDHLEEGETVVARGRAFESHRATEAEPTEIHAGAGPGTAMIVTDRRVLWLDRSDERWLRALPFEAFRRYTEFSQTHRYALVLEHEAVDQLYWVPEHRLFSWSWGNSEAILTRTRSMLAFSHRDTKAALAIRARLQALGVPAGEPRSLPKHEQLESKALAVLRTGRANASVPNRIQALVLGFFVAVWVSLVAIVATAPDIFDRALRLGPGQHTTADATFLAAISAFLLVLSIGVIRRWAWTFWLILVAFLTGILRIPLAALELTDVISTNDPAWYVAFQGALGAVQSWIGLAMLATFRATGFPWGEASVPRGRSSKVVPRA